MCVLATSVLYVSRMAESNLPEILNFHVTLHYYAILKTHECFR